MYSDGSYTPHQRSSFLIRDILGSGSAISVGDKYENFKYCLGSGIGPGHYISTDSSCKGSNGYCQSQYFQRGHWIENAIESRTSKDCSLSIPIPLPVYIRTRSPSATDGYGKRNKCRRSRTVFTDIQLMALEKKFESQKYLSTPDRMAIAETLGLTQLQVKTWYQNRRMKWKKLILQTGCTDSPTKPKGRPRKELGHKTISNVSGSTTCLNTQTRDQVSVNADRHDHADDGIDSLSKIDVTELNSHHVPPGGVLLGSYGYNDISMSRLNSSE